MEMVVPHVPMVMVVPHFTRMVPQFPRSHRCLQELHPTQSVIQDVGSGINFNRKGLQTILVKAMSGELEEIVVAHKDRLARFGYEIIEFVHKHHGVKIAVLKFVW